MSREDSFRATVTVLILAVTALPAARQADRDGQRVMSGTAALAGIVLTDDRDARPLRRARVAVNNAERTVGRTAITDDTGAFTFDNLPPGRYTLTATKDASVTVVYGQRRPGRPGTPLVLAEGQRITDLTLRVPRGAVVTGTVLDENSQPLPGATVRVARSAVQSGARTFVPAGSQEMTDDRGVFRIYGLMPGEYIVSAFAPLGQGPATPEIKTVSEADVRKAMNEVRAPSSSARPGLLPQGAKPPVAASDGAETIAYAPIYYPGVMFANQATRLTLDAGEERRGIDFQLQLVPTAKIEGTVTAPSGVTGFVTVNMLAATDTIIPSFSTHLRTTRTDIHGRFTFTGVTPGQYTLLTRGGSPEPARPVPQQGRSPRTPPLWAQADIIVDGRDMSDITLSLQPGMTIGGTIRFEGSRMPPGDLTRIRVNLFAVQSRGEVTLGVPPAQVESTGRFAISGITPGRYRISSMVPGGTPEESWFLKSAILDGRDVLDETLDLKAVMPRGDIVITFSDTASELSGLVRTASGQPAPDYQIIAFTTDHTLWMPQSRRIQSVRPSADGRYTMRNLPPGEYFLAAVDDVEPGEWFDSAFLQQLAGAAIKVALGEGEQKTQDLILARNRP